MFSALIDAIDRHTKAVDRNTSAQLVLARIVGTAMSALDNLTTAVSNETSVESSAVALIQGLAEQIKTAASSNDSAQVQALADQITASSSALAAAVAANTPASQSAPSNTGVVPPAAGSAPTT